MTGEGEKAIQSLWGRDKKEKGPRAFIIKDGHFGPSRNKAV